MQQLRSRHCEHVVGGLLIVSDNLSDNPQFMRQGLLDLLASAHHAVAAVHADVEPVVLRCDTKRRRLGANVLAHALKETVELRNQPWIACTTDRDRAVAKQLCSFKFHRVDIIGAPLHAVHAHRTIRHSSEGAIRGVEHAAWFLMQVRVWVLVQALRCHRVRRAKTNRVGGFDNDATGVHLNQQTVMSFRPRCCGTAFEQLARIPGRRGRTLAAHGAASPRRRIAAAPREDHVGACIERRHKRFRTHHANNALRLVNGIVCKFRNAA